MTRFSYAILGLVFVGLIVFALFVNINEQSIITNKKLDVLINNPELSQDIESQNNVVSIGSAFDNDLKSVDIFKKESKDSDVIIYKRTKGGFIFKTNKGNHKTVKITIAKSDFDESMTKGWHISDSGIYTVISIPFVDDGKGNYVFEITLSTTCVGCSILDTTTSPIYITEAQSYVNWNYTDMLSNDELKLGTDNYPYKYIENTTAWDFYTINGHFTLSKLLFSNIITTPDKISYSVNKTKSQLEAISISNGSEMFFVIPNSLVENRFIFDKLLPDVCINTNCNSSSNEIYYSTFSGQTRLNYNYSSLNGSDNIVFNFHSNDVNASSTLNINGGQYLVSTNFSCASTCLTISASNISLDLGGYTLTNGMTGNGSAVLVQSGLTNITIKNGSIRLGNVSSAASYGIYFQTTTRSNISNVNVTGENYGFYLSSSSSNTLTNNTANLNSRGFYLSSSSNNTLTNNTANSNTYGFYLYISSNNTLTNNTANLNTYGFILYSSSSNNTLTNNTANSNSRGFYLETSSSNTLTNNTANSNSLHGFYLYSSSNSNILTNNTANSNTQYGFILSTSSNNTLTNNNASNNVLYAIRLLSSNNSILTNNIGTSTTDGGLSLENSYYNTFNQNTFYSLSATSEDIALKTGSNRTNIFNTNWLVPRKIKFYQTNTEFNQTQNGITIITNSSVIIQLNRTLVSLAQNNVSFLENVTVLTMLTYTISGLQPNTVYSKINNSINTQNLSTDIYGNLPINTINLSANIPIILSYITVQLNITSWSNNFTNNQSLYFIANSTAINFNITTNYISDITNWSLNNIDQSNNFDNFTTTLISDGTSYINVSVLNSSYLTRDFKNWTVIILPIPSYNISGYVKNTSNIPLSGANVSCVGCHEVKYNITNSNGFYILSGMNHSFNSYINASLSGYKNQSISVSSLGSDVTNQNFTLLKTGLHLSGYINNSLGVWIQNARVDVDSQYNFSDITGYYNFTDITEGLYSILFRQIGYVNTSEQININTSSQLNVTMYERTNSYIVSAPGVGVSYAILIIGCVYYYKRRKL